MGDKCDIVNFNQQVFMVYDKGSNRMKPSHRRTAVLAALLAAWILLVPLGGGIHRAAAIADPEQDHAVSSVLMDTVQGGSRPRDSVTLPSNVTTYVGASITVMEPFGGLLLPILRWPLQRRSTGAETFKLPEKRQAIPASR